MSETGLSIVKEASGAEFSQSELSGGTKIKKFSLFVDEDTVYSIMAQKPPFSSEWTKSEIYRDYQDEWINIRKAQLDQYPRRYAEDASKQKPIIDKGFISMAGGLSARPASLKIICVNIDYNSVTFYLIER